MISLVILSVSEESRILWQRFFGRLRSLKNDSHTRIATKTLLTVVPQNFLTFFQTYYKNTTKNLTKITYNFKHICALGRT